MTRTVPRLLVAPVLIAATLIAAPAMGPARAQQPSDAVKAMVGGWEISSAERDRACQVQFKADPAKGGYRAELDKSCGEVFAALKDVQSWTVLGDTVRLIDARGRTALEFGEVEGGIFESNRAGGEGLLFLQSLAAVGPAFRTVEQMTGEWSILRGGATLCALTLSTSPVGEDGHALRIKPGCDASVTRFGPVSWRMDRGELVLSSANGDNWRFEEADAAIWRRIPERADGVIMSRK